MKFKKIIGVALLSAVLISSSVFISDSNFVYANNNKENNIKKSDSYENYTLITATVLISQNIFSCVNNTNLIYSDINKQNSTEKNNLNKGYQLIDGDVYDKNGKLLIKMEDGLSPNGFALSPNFRVYYAEDMIENTEKNISTTGFLDIFNGTKNFKLNVTGVERLQIGSDFTLTNSQKNFYVKYSSGTSKGINFSLVNITTQEELVWFSNIESGKSYKYLDAYNSLSPNDSFRVLASAEGNSGNCTLLVQKQ